MQTEIITITFLESDGAEKMRNELHKILPIESEDVAVARDKSGQFKIDCHTPPPHHIDEIGVIGFVAGFVLGGSVAHTLFGGAAGTLLAHPVDLGIPKYSKANLDKNIALSNSVLFVPRCTNQNGIFRRLSNQSDGLLHQLPLTHQAATSINIMVSTMRHYWN